MIRDIGLGGLEEIADFISHYFYLREFREVSFAAVEEAAILVQECRYVALQILDLEITWRSVVCGCFRFLLYCPSFFLLNKRHAPRPLLR